MTKDEYDGACARALKTVQTCRVEPISEWNGWRFHLDELNASIDGWGDATEDEARVGALEHVKAMLGLPADAEIAAASTQMRAIRDRWLAQTDWIGAYLTGGAIPADLPASLSKAITQNADAWTKFRQTLRDLPATVDAFGAWQLVHGHAAWPQAPKAPAVILT